MFGPERPRKRRRGLVLLACVLAGIALGIWHNRTTAASRPNLVTSAIRAFISPFVLATRSMGDWIGERFGWLFRGGDIAEENRRLHEQLARLSEENARLHEFEATAIRLRKQIGLSALPERRRIAAEVVSVRPSPGEESVVINRGTLQGVKPGAVVATAEGLVGQVAEAGLGTSVVRLLTDRDSGVGAMIQRADSRTVGVCRGAGSPVLSFEYLGRDAVVRQGDRVITSGLGGDLGVYPKGIPIGTVISVRAAGAGSTLRVMVTAFADFERLEEVYVFR